MPGREEHHWSGAQSPVAHDLGLVTDLPEPCEVEAGSAGSFTFSWSFPCFSKCLGHVFIGFSFTDMDTATVPVTKGR